ncbi:hypothetical protein [Lentzea sp. NPDC004782]|uniref:hypothetical protein n=1 Tax=Lentzea sp. NPDC004782 TaxID=3154458 RepID=UPI0033AAD70E
MQRIRVFRSSPGDVADERAVALEVLDRLAYEPALRGRVAIEVVAWDEPGAGAPVLATATPQASIAVGLPRPRDCDVVVVVFWARMGTPLPPPEYSRPDGSPTPPARSGSSRAVSAAAARCCCTGARPRC